MKGGGGGGGGEEIGHYLPLEKETEMKMTELFPQKVFPFTVSQSFKVIYSPLTLDVQFLLYGILPSLKMNMT